MELSRVSPRPMAYQKAILFYLPLTKTLAFKQNRSRRRAPETAVSHYCELPQGYIRSAHYPALNKVGLLVRIRGT
jgi:hypothetical protein